MWRSIVPTARRALAASNNTVSRRLPAPVFGVECESLMQLQPTRQNRVTSGVTRKKRHKKVLKMAKGFRGRAKNCYLIAKHRVEKSLQHAYVGRKLKKRNARKDWIQSVNAATREHGLNYSLMIHGMQNANIELNRKVLSELAASEPFAFKSVLLTAESEISEDRLRVRNRNAMRRLYAARDIGMKDAGNDSTEITYTSMNNILRN